MTCNHDNIHSFYREDETPAGLWACSDCGLKFEPLEIRKPMTDEAVMDIVDKVRASVAMDEARVAYRVARAIEAHHGIGSKV